MLILGALIGVVPASGSAGPPRKGPDEAKLREAKELGKSYLRLYEEGKYGEAAALAERACTVLEETHGESSVALADCLSSLGVFYSKQGSYDKAELSSEQALTIRKNILGSDHLDVALSLNNLGVLYQEQGLHEKAEAFIGQALTIRRKVLGAHHADVAESLNNLGALFKDQGRFEEARLLYEQAVAISEKALGPNHPDTATRLNNLALLLQAQGAYEKAEPMLKRALAITERTLGHDHPDVAQSLNNLAALFVAQGLYEKAEPLYWRALAICEKVLGHDHLDVATTLNNLGSLYDDQGLYGRAESLYERALAIREKSLGLHHPHVAMSLNNLASLYTDQGAYKRAEPLYARALTIFEKELGVDHPHVALILNNLAFLYQLEGRYKRAEPLFERALAIIEKKFGSDHPQFATSINNLAVLYNMQGAYEKAEPLYKRAVAIRETTHGAEHPDVALAINNLAFLYKTLGAYEKAEPLYERALAIYTKALGLDHPAVALCLNNLASLYHDLGAHEKAEPLYERALVIRKKVLGPEHPDFAMSLNNLGTLYKDQAMYDKAESLHGQAHAIWEKVLGPDHATVATSLNNLAAVFEDQGVYWKAEPLYRRALAIRERTLGPDHPDVAMSLNNLASLWEATGEYGKVAPLLERSLAIYEKALGSDHLSVAASLNNLAAHYHGQRNHDSALKLQHRAFGIEEANLTRALIAADETRKLAYASRVSGSLHYTLSLHLLTKSEHDTISRVALTALLRRKNRVQEVVAQSNAAFRRLLPDDERHIVDDLTDVDSQIAVLSNRGPGKLGVEAYSRQLDELRRRRDGLWSQLAKHSSFVAALGHPITIEEIQEALPNVGALVELVQYAPQHDDAGVRLRKHDPKLPPRYAAYIIFPDRFDWVDLGPAAPIDEHAKAFRKALQTKQPIPTDLYDAVMRPIVEKLGSAHHLIIAPAGDLSLIPFGALHDGKQYLVEKYDLRYVTTGRDLLAPPATPPVTTTPVTIVANPVGADLPDAELEANFLAGLFPHTRVLLDDQATETNVRTIERPLVLHMATHGFFGDALSERDNPLFRSGLYLADIEQVEVDRERDDGQLTAYEVSGMDLRGTQLVVLSACETGMGATDVRKTNVGNVDMNEGVFGLRRAFAMAGARTTVMSLWEVSGVTAQETMESYYRKLAEGMGRGEAMQAVQLEMLRTKEHAHPKDWAAFIVSGDDTPMVFPKGEGPRMEDEPLPPPVRRPVGCTVAAPWPGRDSSVPASFLSLLGLWALRRRRT